MVGPPHETLLGHTLRDTLSRGDRPSWSGWVVIQESGRQWAGIL
jgi:hypothetical protein